MGGRFALCVILVSLTCVGCVRFGGQPPPDAAQLSDAPLSDAPLPDAPLPDGCELYFISTRPGGVGGWDLYRSEYIKQP